MKESYYNSYNIEKGTIEKIAGFTIFDRHVYRKNIARKIDAMYGNHNEGATCQQ